MSLEVRIRKKYKGGMLDVQFTADGGTFALLGEKDGAMSLALRCIAGMETPDEGRIVLNDTVFYDSLAGINLRPRERRVGCLFPDSTLYKRLSIKENIRLSLLGHGRKLLVGEDTRARLAVLDSRVNEFLETYHLDGLGGCYPGELSPLQRRQAAFAAMMAGNPRLVLLDDPFSLLEEYRKAETLQEIRELLRNKGLPAVLASTDLDEVYAMGESIAAIRGGRTEPMQKRADFFAHPATLQAALLAGCHNIAETRLLDPYHALTPHWGSIFSFRGEDNELTRFSPSLKAIGIQERSFVTEWPRDASGRELPAYKFSVYRPRIEERRNDWNLIFSPLRRGCGKELVWTVPKTQMDQEEILAVRRLYVRAEQILLLL